MELVESHTFAEDKLTELPVAPKLLQFQVPFSIGGVKAKPTRVELDVNKLWIVGPVDPPGVAVSQANQPSYTSSKLASPAEFRLVTLVTEAVVPVMTA